MTLSFQGAVVLFLYSLWLIAFFGGGGDLLVVGQLIGPISGIQRQSASADACIHDKQKMSADLFIEL